MYGYPKILVDADACPVKEDIMHIAIEYNVSVCFITNINQNLKNKNSISDILECHESLFEFIIVDDMRDAADYEIVNRTNKGDIVVSQDYGLAAMVLSKGGCFISNTGKIVSGKNIDSLLDQRHFSRKERMKGNRTKGPAKFSEENREKFNNNLRKLLNYFLENEKD